MSQSFLFTGIRDRKFLSDDDFSLLLYSGDRKGCDYPFTPAFMSSWIMGNLAWSCTVPPFLIMNNIDKTQWSKWVELMTKDVACTFDTQRCGYVNQSRQSLVDMPCFTQLAFGDRWIKRRVEEWSPSE